LSITAECVVDILKKSSFFDIAGVPDSTFGSLFKLIDQDPEINYYRANREDTALGISSGVSISGKNSCILMQNSGIGNIINPLTSFNLLYKIPLLLIIGWRGYGGKPNDAPEHWIMGEKTKDYFSMLGIPYITFENTEEDSDNLQKKLMAEFKTYSKQPQIKAIIIKSGVIA